MKSAKLRERSEKEIRSSTSEERASSRKKTSKQVAEGFAKERVYQEYALLFGPDKHKQKRRRGKDSSTDNNIYPVSTGGRSSLVGPSAQASTLQLPTSRTNSQTKDTFPERGNNSTSSLLSLNLLEPRLQPHPNKKRSDLKDKNLRHLKGAKTTVKSHHLKIEGNSAGVCNQKSKTNGMLQNRKKSNVEKKFIKPANFKDNKFEQTHSKKKHQKQKETSDCKPRESHYSELHNLDVSNTALKELDLEKFKHIEKKLHSMKKKLSSASVKALELAGNCSKRISKPEVKPNFTLSTKIDKKDPYLFINEPGYPDYTTIIHSIKKGHSLGQKKDSISEAKNDRPELFVKVPNLVIRKLSKVSRGTKTSRTGRKNKSESSRSVSKEEILEILERGSKFSRKLLSPRRKGNSNLSNSLNHSRLSSPQSRHSQASVGKKPSKKASRHLHKLKKKKRSVSRGSVRSRVSDCRKKGLKKKTRKETSKSRKSSRTDSRSCNISLRLSTSLKSRAGSVNSVRSSSKTRLKTIKRNKELNSSDLYFKRKTEKKDKKSAEKKKKKIEKAWKHVQSQARNKTEESSQKYLSENILSPHSERLNQAIKKQSRFSKVDIPETGIKNDSFALLKKQERPGSKSKSPKHFRSKELNSASNLRQKPSKSRSHSSNKPGNRRVSPKSSRAKVPKILISPNLSPPQAVAMKPLSPEPRERERERHERHQPEPSLPADLPLEPPELSPASLGIISPGQIFIPPQTSLPAQVDILPAEPRERKNKPSYSLKKEDSMDEPICIKNDSGSEGIKDHGDRIAGSRQDSARRLRTSQEISLSNRQTGETSTPMLSETDIEGQFKKFMENQEHNFQRFAKIIDRLTTQPNIQNSLFQKCLDLRRRGEMSIKLLKESASLNPNQFKTERKALEKQAYSINIGNLKTSKENLVSPKTSPLLSETPKMPFQEAKKTQSIVELSPELKEASSSSKFNSQPQTLMQSLVLQQTKVFPIAEIVKKPSQKNPLENLETVENNIEPQPQSLTESQTSLKSKLVSNLSPLNPRAVSPHKLAVLPQPKPKSANSLGSSDRFPSPGHVSARFTEKWVEPPGHPTHFRDSLHLLSEASPENLEKLDKSESSAKILQAIKVSGQNSIFGSMLDRGSEGSELHGESPKSKPLSREDSMKNSQILIRDEIISKPIPDNLQLSPGEAFSQENKINELSISEHSSAEGLKKSLICVTENPVDELLAQSSSEPIKIEGEIVVSEADENQNSPILERDNNIFSEKGAIDYSSGDPISVEDNQELQKTENVSAGASIDFAKLTSEDKAFAIADFILENLIVEVFTLDYRTRDRMGETARKMVLRKQHQSTQEISKYLGQIFTLINESPEEQLDIYTRLNSPLVMTDLQRLLLASSLLPSEEQIALGKIDYESVLSIQLYIRLEETLRDTEYVARGLSPSQVEREHIIHKLLFDSLNERLDYSRVLGMLPTPPQFSSHFSPQKLVTPDDCARILEQSKKDVIEWSLEKFGLLAGSFSPQAINQPGREEEVAEMELQREEGLNRHLAGYIEEIESKWYSHHDEMLEVFVSSCDWVFDTLVEGCIEDFKNIQSGRGQKEVQISTTSKPKKFDYQENSPPREVIRFHSSPVRPSGKDLGEAKEEQEDKTE